MFTLLTNLEPTGYDLPNAFVTISSLRLPVMARAVVAVPAVISAEVISV